LPIALLVYKSVKENRAGRASNQVVPRFAAGNRRRATAYGINAEIGLAAH
jgi:hypothetical protein